MVSEATGLRKPFLKWAGCKTKLVGALRPFLPAGEFRLIEPFVGAGAVFLNTGYTANLLCDSNKDLIGLYAVLARRGAAFMEVCEELFTPENNRPERFYALRAEFNARGEAERRAALFVYLNRHCYNGLCRYNRSGQFNTPFGRYDRPYFPRAEMFEFAAKLEGATLAAQDFRVSLAAAARGDVVYCDPPYVPLSATANFTAYAGGGFSLGDQEELAARAGEAARRGAVVILSNHDLPLTRRLYHGCEIVSVSVHRAISCNGQNRGKAEEIIAVFKH